MKLSTTKFHLSYLWLQFEAFSTFIIKNSTSKDQSEIPPSKSPQKKFDPIQQLITYNITMNMTVPMPSLQS
jgi:hypothetical protein